MLQEAIWALGQIAQPESLLLLLVAACVGMVMGALPGLGGAITLALLIPFSFSLGQVHGLLFLIGALAGVNFGGSVPAILLNIPGQGPSVITTIDGYAMSQQGRAADAIGASATASALGAAVGVVFLLAAIPVFKQIMRSIGPPEFMLIALIGVFTLAYVLQGSVVNGLIGAGVGVVLGFHGFDAITGSLRFAFGTTYLYDGIPLVILVLGIFAITEMLDLGRTATTVAEDPHEVHSSPIPGILETLRHLRLVVKSGIIGIVIGFIPAAGSTIATLIAYAQAKDTERDGTFGEGDIRGVIAPEAANDAKDGGALLPTIAFAIPGTAAHAVLLGGLLLHGITPGPSVFNEDLPLILLLVFGLLLGNFITSGVGLALTKQLSVVTRIPADIIIPSVVVISLFGAFSFRLNEVDMIAVMVLGILGYGALVFDVSRIAILFGLILGPIVERTFHQTIQIARGDAARILGRPAFAVILVVLVLGVTYVAWRNRRAAAG